MEHELLWYNRGKLASVMKILKDLDSTFSEGELNTWIKEAENSLEKVNAALFLASQKPESEKEKCPASRVHEIMSSSGVHICPMCKSAI